MKSFFKDLSFNEELHKYYVNEKPINKSVSKLIELYKYPVNWEAVLKGVSKKRGISEDEILKEWKQAADLGCSIGDRVHLFGETYPFNKSLEPSDGYEEAIVKFWNDLPPYICIEELELKMYHKDYLYAGTTDIVLKDKRSGEYILADYKTNKDLFKNFNNQRMKSPFNFLLCMPLSHYKLQLNFYQILIEQIKGVKISKRVLVWVKPDGEYQLFQVEDLTNILKEELKNKNIC